MRDIGRPGAGSGAVAPGQHVDPRMARSNRINLRLRNALSLCQPDLATLLEDESLPTVAVLANGPRAHFRWRLDLRLGDETLLQLGLTDAVLSDLNCNDDALLRLAGVDVANALLAPVLQRLRTWTNGMPRAVLVAAPADRLEMGGGALFRLQVKGPTGVRHLAGQMSERLATRMLEVMQRWRPSLVRHLPLPIHLGRQIRLPVNELLALAPGDVVLLDREQRGATIDVLVAQRSGAEAFKPVARLQRSSGRSVGGSVAANLRQPDRRGPMVRIDILEAKGISTTTTLCGLQPGISPRFWRGAEWFERAELRVNGRLVGWAARAVVAGCAGYEILALAGPDARITA